MVSALVRLLPFKHRPAPMSSVRLAVYRGRYAWWLLAFPTPARMLKARTADDPALALHPGHHALLPARRRLSRNQDERPGHGRRVPLAARDQPLNSRQRSPTSHYTTIRGSAQGPQRRNRGMNRVVEERPVCGVTFP